MASSRASDLSPTAQWIPTCPSLRHLPLRVSPQHSSPPDPLLLCALPCFLTVVDTVTGLQGPLRNYGFIPSAAGSAAGRKARLSARLWDSSVTEPPPSPGQSPCTDRWVWEHRGQPVTPAGTALPGHPCGVAELSHGAALWLTFSVFPILPPSFQPPGIPRELPNYPLECDSLSQRSLSRTGICEPWSPGLGL